MSHVAQLGWTVIWDEPHLMRVMPWPWLLGLPVYNLYTIYLMGIDSPYLLLGAYFYAFLTWIIFR